MEGFKIGVMLGLFIIMIPSSYGVSVSCMMTYDEGGVFAVLESPECSEWVLSAGSPQNQTVKCQSATLQGHRKYQEDRIVCHLHMKIPLLGKNGLEEVTVGVVAVFDGHGGNEASEVASKLLLDYFYMHAVFISYKLTMHYKGVLPVTDDEITHLKILKEALLRAIHDIDLKFSQATFQKKLLSGSTATVALLVDRQILIANVGDSKALLCTEKIESVAGNLTTSPSATELTEDHHPDRDDERARIEAAGGYVAVWGVPRVNGVLAMSRSIGDVYLKRFGVIPVPEVTGWQPLNADSRFLVVSTDGTFESLTAQDVCDIMYDSGSCSASSSLAECIVNTAFEKGSMDNLSVIVVPL
ncbi:probable protein phosphatase 2C 51 isoform X3 [Alnus glutinosa]|uniref:probable protein phosphatase 2C 51 isoform X3 n=1 Tax=Alnus glutinosa TaxID=3517 RepID=UPI002D78FD41|nr:probable protein phosphatase 2C 51 isoform X3 [Alnus glutinosa]